MKRNVTPSYLPHSASGRARAVWTDSTGTRHQKLLPGKFASPESQKAFAQLQLEITSAPLNKPQSTKSALTIPELLLAYVEYAEKHYRLPDGTPTSEVYEIKIVVKSLRELYPDKAASEFGPLSLKAARQRWVDEKRSRT
ncbi:MAG TPA: site-specific integrase, partial [Gemmata sp.]|nr:site-specific integrase [Gemmata sp.]